MPIMRKRKSSSQQLVKQNSLLNYGIKVPSSPMGSAVRIRHQEYLGDITSSTGLTLSMNEYPNGLPINPGSSTTFPWLSQIAAAFQEYRFHGLYFHFVSTCGSAISSTNNALGTVIMATNYNAGQPVFTTKQQMEQTLFNNSSKPTRHLIHPVECKGRGTVLSELYILPIGSGEDIKMYNIGTFQIATQGMQQAGIVIGELHVSYDIELFKPELSISSVSSGESVWSAHLQSTAAASSGTTLTNWFEQSNAVVKSSSFPTNAIQCLADNQISIWLSGLPVGSRLLLGFSVKSQGIASAIASGFLTITPHNGLSLTSPNLFTNVATGGPAQFVFLNEAAPTGGESCAMDTQTITISNTGPNSSPGNTLGPYFVVNNPTFSYTLTGSDQAFCTDFWICVVNNNFA